MWRIFIVIIVIFVIYRLPLQGDIPKEMIKKAEEIDRMSKTKLELAKNVYDFVNMSYGSPLRQYLREPNKIFIKDINSIWNSRGSYMPSNAQNDIFKIMLTSTGRFQDNEFIYHQSFCLISPHEYYELKIENQTYFIDLWMADNTILNNSFGCYSPPPCIKEKYICTNGFP